MCRKEMTGKEDLPPSSEEADDDEDDEDEDDDDEDDEDDDYDVVRFSYAGINRLLRSRGGAGLPMVAWLHLTPQNGRVCFWNVTEFNFFLIGNRVSPITSEEWDRMETEEGIERDTRDMSTVHLLADGRWVQEVMNPEEDTGVIACVQKEEVPDAPVITHLLAKKIQKKWRSTKPITLQELEAQLFSN